MLSSDPRYGNYLKILQEELVPATGCTEPIAIAYGTAKAREASGRTARIRSGGGQRQHHQKR